MQAAGLVHPNLERDPSSDTQSAWGFSRRQRYGSVFVCGAGLQPWSYGRPGWGPGTMTVNRPSGGETFEAELIAGEPGFLWVTAVHTLRAVLAVGRRIIAANAAERALLEEHGFDLRG